MSEARWVVFDHGRVLSRPTAALPRLAAALGVALEPFRAAYFDLRARYDAGWAPPHCWSAVGDRVGAHVDEQLAAELTEIDDAGWLDVAPDSLRLVEELRSRAVPKAVLSNAPSGLGRAVAEQPWAGAFAHLVFSGDLGITKPDPAIYEHLLGLLGVPAADCAFFDDRQDNVDAAAELGMRARLRRGAESARASLLP